MSQQLKKFRIEHLHALRAASESIGSNRIQCENVSNSETVVLASCDFGNNFTDVAGDTTTMDAVDEGAYHVHHPQIFTIRDAVIRTQFGLITIDDWLARESTFHFPMFKFKDFKYTVEQPRETFLEMPAVDPSLSLTCGYSIHAGINANYYHWMVLFLPKINRLFLESKLVQQLGEIPVIIFPDFLDGIQRESAAAVAQIFRLPFISLQKPVSVNVQKLIYPIHLRSGGLKPHPSITDTFSILREIFYDPTDAYPNKIYVSRRDTPNRVMINEQEVEEFLASRGFEIVFLTGKSFKDQLNYFAHASKIIGPHGAGLTNVAFCKKGASFLELHIPSHLNWCYRRLAGVCSLRYGFLYGELTEGLDRYVNLRKYRVDISALRLVVDSGKF